MGSVARSPRVSSLLINEPPLIILPSLAVKTGLHEAIFLQQLHYWLQGKGGKVVDGRRWVYNTRKEWQEQFPFWSVDTIKRAVESLKKQNLVETNSSLNKSKMDRTLWYSINYDALNDLANTPDGEAIAPIGEATAQDGFGLDAHSNHETTQETTQEKTQEKGLPPVSLRSTSPTGERVRPPSSINMTTPPDEISAMLRAALRRAK